MAALSQSQEWQAYSLLSPLFNCEISRLRSKALPLKKDERKTLFFNVPSTAHREVLNVLGNWDF